MKRAAALLAIGLAAIAALAAQDATHVLARIRFEVTGMTRPEALARAVGLREKAEFPSAEALDAYLADARQEMLNLRVFKSVSYNDSICAEGPGRVEHEVLFRVADSFTLIPIPYVVYDSNSGFEAGLEVHYDNAFGTLTDWYINPYFRIHERDGGYPMAAWKVNPKVEGLRVGKVALTVELDQEKVETQIRQDGALTADYAYYLSALEVGAKIDLGGDWTYTVSPRAEWRYGYVDYSGEGGFNREGLGLALTQDLEMERVDWIDNFRKGFDAKLEHVFKVLDREGEAGLANELALEASWYLPFLRMDYYGRAKASAYFNEGLSALGGDLRGILDSDFSGTGALVLNQTLAFRLLRWKGVLDLQLHPFLDAGAVMPGDRPFDAEKDLRFGAGADAALYVDALANLVLRATFGVDLGSPSLESALGAMEIIVTTSLSY